MFVAKNHLIKNVVSACGNLAGKMDGKEVYGSDLPYELFYRLNYTSSNIQSEFDIADLGIWICLNLVKTYDLRRFGELCTRLYPLDIAHRVYSIIGSYLLNKSAHLSGEAWDRVLTKKDLEVIQSELRAYIDNLSDDYEFWVEVCQEYDV